MRKVAILVSASPASATLSRIAAISLALNRLDWQRWQASLYVFIDEEEVLDASRSWLRHLGGAVTVLGPAGQQDGLLRWAPADADVLVRIDADTLPVGDLEDVLDHVVDTESIAGVIANSGFSDWPGVSSREAWQRTTEGLISASLKFNYCYSMASAETPEDDRLTPFYVDSGAIFLPTSIYRDLAERVLRLRLKLSQQLPMLHCAGPVALALAIAELGTRTCALPLRYNFPNDDVAGSRYPEELADARIFHLLKTEKFDPQRIFDTPTLYDEFAQVRLTGVNGVFQERVLKIVGPGTETSWDFPHRDPSPSLT